MEVTKAQNFAVQGLAVQDLARADILPWVVAPTAESHKYTRGVLGLLTGSETYPGAAMISARAAVNTGAGLVRFAGTAALNFQVQLTVPEAVCSVGEAERLRVDAWAVGSGVVGERREAEAAAVIAGGAAAVLDAGAVAVAARLLADGVMLQPHHLLTPHAGELVDAVTWLLALTPAAIQRANPEVREAPTRADVEAHPAFYALLLAQATGATVMLKGGVTFLASPTGQVYRVQGTVPWLATAGSGDTLTGILGTLLARYQTEEANPGANPTDYAKLGAAAVLLHQEAAALVHGEGPLGPTPPTLVAQQLPSALARFLAA